MPYSRWNSAAPSVYELCVVIWHPRGECPHSAHSNRSLSIARPYSTLPDNSSQFRKVTPEQLRHQEISRRTTAPFVAGLLPRTFDQNVPHGACGREKKCPRPSQPGSLVPTSLRYAS